MVDWNNKEEVREYQRNYYWKNREKRLTQWKNHTISKQAKESHKDRERKRYWNQPQKAKVYNTTTYAIKTGKLIKQPCEKCGRKEVEAHHEDYNKPLDVMWLCHKCHMELHSKIDR